ncbi:MAG: phenylalanine--tRNA ligase subunit beta [Flavobacteriales bacterium]|nr:phenylalanine--tRNA ligase subunit beta [Flavobacteriales bacterium]
MKISYNWLKEFAPVDLPAEQAAEILTDLGLEIEGLDKWESLRGGLKGVVVGKVLTCVEHPNSDHLHITTVDLGNGHPVQIVCGAPNVKAGQTVPVATLGTVLYDEKGESFTIKESKIRGEKSFGMICAEDELGIGTSHDGIMVLDDALKAGTPAAEVFGIEVDDVFEIGLTPNRADAMGHLGVVRDLLTRLKYHGKEINITMPDTQISTSDEKPVKIVVESPEKAPRYSGIVIKGVKIAPSPSWLANRLRAVGINPINNVVDITNYVMESLGQPLHAFDMRCVGSELHVRTCMEGTPFVTLDGVEHKLSSEDLMICSKTEPMCLAGVYGGENSGIKDDTTDVFIESAYFNPVSIRKTAKRHGFHTEASFRFERGIDPNLTIDALKLAAHLMCSVAGGSVSSQITDICSDESIKKPFEVTLRLSHTAKLLGADIPADDIKKILNALQIEIVADKGDELDILVPAYRVDVQREADVIEDILRVYGYNNIPVTDQMHTAIVSDDKKSPERLFNIVGDLLSACGYNEIMSNSLTKGAYADLTADIDSAATVHLLNPLSSDLDSLRQNLLFSALEAVNRNISFRSTDLRMFELGKVYNKFADKYVEERHIAMVITGKKTMESWQGAQQDVTFYDLRADMERVLFRMGIKDLHCKPCSSDLFAEGVEIFHKKTQVARIGKVSKKILKAMDIAQEVFYCDILWENVLKLAREVKVTCQDLPKFPSVRRDLALLVDKTVTYEQLHAVAFSTEKNILRSVNLFDVYEGKNLPDGKKSYALSFTLSDESKTLDDKRIDGTMKKLADAFEKQLGSTLRQ